MRSLNIVKPGIDIVVKFQNEIVKTEGDFPSVFTIHQLIQVKQFQK